MVSLTNLLWVGGTTGLENLPKNGGAIIAANHCSYLDFIIIPSVVTAKIGRNASIMAASELTKHPAVGVFARNDDCILLNRNKIGKVLEADFFKKGVKALREGKLLLVFPEGTRSLDGSLRLWKPGFVKLAIEARAPIIPTVIKGTFDILPKGHSLPRIGKRSELAFLKPVSLDQYYAKKPDKSDMLKIAESFRARVAKALE